MVSSACVELPRGPFGLVFSLRNIKNITRQVGVSLYGPCYLEVGGVLSLWIFFVANFANWHFGQFFSKLTFFSNFLQNVVVDNFFQFWQIVVPVNFSK